MNADKDLVWLKFLRNNAGYNGNTSIEDLLRLARAAQKAIWDEAQRIHAERNAPSGETVNG